MLLEPISINHDIFWSTKVPQIIGISPLIRRKHFLPESGRKKCVESKKRSPIYIRHFSYFPTPDTLNLVRGEIYDSVLLHFPVLYTNQPCNHVCMYGGRRLRGATMGGNKLFPPFFLSLSNKEKRVFSFLSFFPSKHTYIEQNLFPTNKHTNTHTQADKNGPTIGYEFLFTLENNGTKIKGLKSSSFSGFCLSLSLSFYSSGRIGWWRFSC